MLRIVGGAAAGVRLERPRGAQVRPATDRMRESLFALLAGELAGRRVLDLFAGSGVLGLEALSRGAACCTFVEKDPQARAVIARNVRAVGFPARCEILAHDLAAPLALREPAGCVFLDPPFCFFADAPGRECLRRLLAQLGQGLLAAGGKVVLRHEEHDEAHAAALLAEGRWLVVMARRYGRSAVKVLDAPPAGAGP